MQKAASPRGQLTVSSMQRQAAGQVVSVLQSRAQAAPQGTKSESQL